MPTRLSITPVLACDDLPALARVVIDADPGYQPQVSDGTRTAAEWFHRKECEWRRVARRSGEAIGFLAARPYRDLPGGVEVPEAYEWEMCRLMVHPAHQGRGVASRLIDSAVAVFGEGLWATAQAGSICHRLLLGRGWSEHAEVTFADDPVPGVALLCTERRGL